MGHCYSHLSIAEREDIMTRWCRHEGIGRIAGEIGRSKSTVSREVRRNGSVTNGGRWYRASTAQGRADARRERCRRPRLLDDPERRRVVVEKIAREHWSPEQVERRLGIERPELYVSDATIYRAVNGGELDCELPGHRKFKTRLRHKGKRRKGAGRVETRGKIGITHDVADRPAAADERSRPGDWEGDTVAGRQGGACLVTLDDRRSRFLAGGLAAEKRSAPVNAVAERALAGKPVETLTLDRGKEFAGAAELEEAIGAPVYFCLPHHPWQRPTNENCNGLIREFFPKGKPLDGVTDAEVQRVYDALNHRPRKCLGWKCPYEVFYGVSLHLI